MTSATWLLALTILLAGCAPATRVVLLPQAGHTGAVEVTTRTSSAVLSRPYEAAVLDAGNIATEQLDAETVQKHHPLLLSMQPAAEKQFTLYFESGSTRLTPESLNELTTVLGAAAARPGAEIIIIGHTDRVGRRSANDSLSMRRAHAIRDELIRRGFDAAYINVFGRGANEPRVPTAGQVAEPQNRRVEIVVR